MKIAIAEHLIEKAARRKFGNFSNIMASLGQAVDIINPDAIDPFNDQHAFGAVFQIHPWHINTLIIVHIIGKPSCRRRFEAQIKLHF